jgi:hypothetical protein
MTLTFFEKLGAPFVRNHGLRGAVDIGAAMGEYSVICMPNMEPHAGRGAATGGTSLLRLFILSSVDLLSLLLLL